MGTSGGVTRDLARNWADEKRDGLAGWPNIFRVKTEFSRAPGQMLASFSDKPRVLLDPYCWKIGPRTLAC